MAGQPWYPSSCSFDTLTSQCVTGKPLCHLQSVNIMQSPLTFVDTGASWHPAYKCDCSLCALHQCQWLKKKQKNLNVLFKASTVHRPPQSTILLSVWLCVFSLPAVTAVMASAAQSPVHWSPPDPASTARTVTASSTTTPQVRTPKSLPAPCSTVSTATTAAAPPTTTLTESWGRRTSAVCSLEDDEALHDSEDAVKTNRHRSCSSKWLPKVTWTVCVCVNERVSVYMWGGLQIFGQKKKPHPHFAV